MTTGADRRTRRRQQLFEELLSATRTVARSEGWHAVTIRKISAELGMTSAAIYRYVDSKGELMEELIRRGFAQLANVMRSSATDAREPLRAAVQAYLGFARAEPDLYRAMYGLDGARFVEGTAEEGSEIGRIIAEAMVHEGWLEAPDPLHPEILRLWATVHGLVALRASGRLPEDPVGLADQAVDRLGAELGD
ncbi:MAG: TetR/AcrR family transcriptional regulator [Myxococcota bacterium]